MTSQLEYGCARREHSLSCTNVLSCQTQYVCALCAQSSPKTNQKQNRRQESSNSPGKRNSLVHRGWLCNTAVQSPWCLAMQAPLPYAEAVGLPCGSGKRHSRYWTTSVSRYTPTEMGWGNWRWLLLLLLLQDRRKVEGYLFWLTFIPNTNAASF